MGRTLGDAERLEDPVVPRAVDVDQAGDARVREVGDVGDATSVRCQMIQVSTVPKHDVAGSVGVDLVEEVRELRGGLVRREAQAVGLEHQAVAEGAEVLPAESGCEGLAGGPVPDDRRGTLVGDADGGDRSVGGEHTTGRRDRRVGRELVGVELDEPGAGVDGSEGTRCSWTTVTSGGDDGGPRRAGADVDDQDAHGSWSPVSGCRVCGASAPTRVRSTGRRRPPSGSEAGAEEHGVHDAERARHEPRATLYGDLDQQKVAAPATAPLRAIRRPRVRPAASPTKAAETAAAGPSLRMGPTPNPLVPSRSKRPTIDRDRDREHGGAEEPPTDGAEGELTGWRSPGESPRGGGEWVGETELARG